MHTRRVALTLLLSAAVTHAEVTADHPAHRLSPDEVVRQHVLPNIHTDGVEAAEVEQTTGSPGHQRQQTDRLLRLARIHRERATVHLLYRTGSRAEYRDRIVSGGGRLQEFKPREWSPEFRRLTTGKDMAIGPTAYSFRDLHWRLEDYRWTGKEARGGRLWLTGEGGQYPRVALEADVVSGALVVISIQSFDPADELRREEVFQDFTRLGAKVRPRLVRMTEYRSGTALRATTSTLTWITDPAAIPPNALD